MRGLRTRRRAVRPDNTRDTLIRARALIADPDHWCQGSFREDGDKYCLWGSILAAGETVADKVDAHYAVQALTEDGVVAYNDSHEHGEVLALLDRAIEGAP